MNLSECFVKDAPELRGIHGFRDWRFYMVTLLLLGSTLCLMRDPYFIVHGEFVYRQGAVVLLLALVIHAAFAWETPIFEAMTTIVTSGIGRRRARLSKAPPIEKPRRVS